MLSKPITSYQKQINAIDSWGQGLTGKGVKIAVIDTGFNSNSETVNDYHLLSTTGSSSDTYGHGTRMINIISGDSGYYFGGVAPGAEIYSIKASIGDSNQFNQSDIAKAIDSAVLLDVDIISMALSNDGNMESTLFNSLKMAKDAGIEIVVSAGNSKGKDIVFWEGVDAHVVGSINQSGIRSTSSQEGVELDIYAPGEKIPTFNLNGTVAIINGTSPAEAIVAGSIALLIESGGNIDNIYARSLPVINEEIGQLNIGFATHATSIPIMHHFINNSEMSISYLIPQQDQVYNICLYVEINDETYDLDGSGNFVKYSGGNHSLSFQNIDNENELVGNLFGYKGLYDNIDTLAVPKGEYKFNLELVDSDSQLINVIGQEIVLLN